MLELITKEEARDQIRLDSEQSSLGVTGPDDAWLSIWIPAVSEAIRSWVKDDWRLYLPSRDSNGDVITDSDGDPVPEESSDGFIVHPTVRGAALLEIASQYRYREGEGDARMEAHEGHGYTLSRGATLLLSGLRKTTVA